MNHFREGAADGEAVFPSTEGHGSLSTPEPPSPIYLEPRGGRQEAFTNLYQEEAMSLIMTEVKDEVKEEVGSEDGLLHQMSPVGDGSDTSDIEVAVADTSDNYLELIKLARKAERMGPITITNVTTPHSQPSTSQVDVTAAELIATIRTPVAPVATVTSGRLPTIREEDSPCVSDVSNIPLPKASRQEQGNRSEDDPSTKPGGKERLATTGTAPETSMAGTAIPSVYHNTGPGARVASRVVRNSHLGARMYLTPRPYPTPLELMKRSAMGMGQNTTNHMTWTEEERQKYLQGRQMRDHVNFGNYIYNLGKAAIDGGRRGLLPITPGGQWTHIQIDTNGYNAMTAVALVDPDDVWENVILEEMFHRLGFDPFFDLDQPARYELKRFRDGTIVPNGQKPVMQIMGRLQTDIFIQIGDQEVRMRCRPMVVDGLPCHAILSGPFLAKNQVYLAHPNLGGQGYLAVQGRKTPLMRTLEWKKVPDIQPEYPLAGLYVKADTIIPATTRTLVEVTAPSMMKGLRNMEEEDALISGSGYFMRTTNLHPWMNALVRIDQKGCTYAGVCNTTNQAITIPKGTRYGTIQLAINQAHKDKYPKRVHVLETIDDKDHGPIRAGWPMNIVDKPREYPDYKTALPKWVTGDNIPIHRRKRIRYIFQRFQLHNKPALKKLTMEEFLC